MNTKVILFLVLIVFVLIVYFKSKQIDVKNAIIKNIVKFEPNQNQSFLVLFFNIQTNISEISEKINSLSFDKIYIIYKGPEWKLNITRKSLSGNLSCIADEEGDLFDKLGIIGNSEYAEITYLGKCKYGRFE